MQEPQQIWEFGRWIARQETGSARLTWTEGEVLLALDQGRIHHIDGLDAAELGRRLGCEPTGESELLAEAKALCAAHGVPETRAVGTAKAFLQESLHRWLMDPDREFAVDDEVSIETDGATISVTHAMVELVLADTRHDVAGCILPDSEVSLQRSASFLELYSPLRLSEEADLIVADITGNVTAASVARDSKHHPDEVIRLVAALVATGAIEVAQPVVTNDELDWSADDFDMEETRRRIPPWAMGLVAVVLVIALAVVAWLIFGSKENGSPSTAVAGDWGVVVEMGCEPHDLQRMLRKRNQERKTLRTVKADPTNGDACFRLVWGSFTSEAEAEEALSEIPEGMIEEGFQPHVVEVTEDEADGEIGTEG